MLGVNDTPEGMNEDMVVVAVIVAPLQLVEVSVKMLHADLVEGSYDATLEQGPDTLNTVGVNVSDSPLLNGVVDRLMSGVVVLNPQVRSKLVGVDGFSLVTDSPVDEAVESGPLGIRYSLQPYAAVTLDSTGNPSLVAFIGPALSRVLPPTRVSSTSTIPRRVGPSKGSVPIASRIR